MPDAVIDSTGNSHFFSAALGMVGYRGTLVLLGDTGQPAQQCLGSDVLTRGLTIKGVHDGHNTPEWSNGTITELFFRLAARGAISLAGMNTNFFPAADCAEAYATANRDRATTMGIIFDWKDKD